MTVRGFIGKILMYMCRMFPIDEKKIVFESFGGLYNDNPKALYENILSKYPNYHYIWVSNGSTNIKGAKTVSLGTIPFLFHMSTAKIWIDNCRKQEWIVKRRNQVYIQTWHGGIGLKRVEKDAENLPKSYTDAAKHDSQMADLFISNSKWLTDVYHNSFWYSGKVLEYGLPKEDKLYTSKTDAKKKVDAYIGTNKEVRYLLYAPTFRDDHNCQAYNIDYEQLHSSLEARDGCTWKILIRLHPNILNLCKISKDRGYVVDVSKYSDINDLILSSEILISDYSSCLFDALIAGVKVIDYASDIEEYNQERGLLFDIYNLPFPVATNNKELLSIINDFKENDYQERTEKFLDQCGFVKNPHSSSDIVSFIATKYLNEK